MAVGMVEVEWFWLGRRSRWPIPGARVSRRLRRSFGVEGDEDEDEYDGTAELEYGVQGCEDSSHILHTSHSPSSRTRKSIFARNLYFLRCFCRSSACDASTSIRYPESVSPYFSRIRAGSVVR